ncbi:MAG: sulfatase-like hydrolase/transferase [Planctomycetales bacterium]|nr:sulfatase-like hydrolase/transferase [Planctomycetales bacterium]
MIRFFSIAVGLVGGILSIAAVASGKSPNVIVILTDDQGSVDAGCYGAQDLTTPAVDRLAATGVRLTQFYSAAPVCSPSRAGLLTGRYPWRVGVPNNAGAGPREDVDNLELETGNQGLHDSAVTMAEMFRQAGYRTAHIGKWHLGHGPGSKPLDQGFDYSFGHMSGCIDNFAHFFYWNGPNRHDLWENNLRVRMPGQFFPDLMVDKASQFIQENRDEPFFIYFASNMPHYPYQGDPRWVERYRELSYPRNLYAAFLSTLDARVGRILDLLEKEGLREDTIVVYQSDNGFSREERAHYGGGSSGPYRGEKFSMFEGGIRLPAIISWPSQLPQGAVRTQMAHACDWLPTLAELCNVHMLDESVDGKSIAAVLRSADADSPHDWLAWNTQSQWAIRQGPWKLIHRVRTADEGQLSAEDKEFFLVNLDEDIGETTNLASQHPQVLGRLKSEFAKQFEK